MTQPLKRRKAFSLLILALLILSSVTALLPYLPIKQAKADPTFTPLTISGRYWTDPQGDPVFLAGVVYPFHGGSGNFWSNYNAEEIASNLTAIKANGFNMVTLHVAESQFEETEGDYTSIHYTHLLEVLNMLKDRDMYAMLRTPDYCSGSDNWVKAYWKNEGFYYGTDTTFRQIQANFLANLTYQIYQNNTHEVIAGIDVWAEADCDQTGTYGKKNFIGSWEDGAGVNTTALRANANDTWHNFLANKYESISHCNDTWKNSQVSADPIPAGVTSFDEIPLPNSTYYANRYSARGFDLQLMHIDVWYNATKVRTDACKTHYDFPVGGSISGYIWKNQPESQGTYKPKAYLEESHIADIVDIIMVDTYGVMLGNFQSLGTYHRRWDKPLMGIEYGIKTTLNDISYQKRFWTEAYGNMLTQGCGASAIWTWQDANPTYGYGLCEIDGTPKPILPFLNATNQLVKIIQSELDQLLFDDEIAVIMSQTTIHKGGVVWPRYGFFSIPPIELSRINIYPTVIFEGSNASEADRRLLKADWNLSDFDNKKILVWGVIDATFQVNSTWWNATLSQMDAGLIMMGYPSFWGEYKEQSDEYGWDVQGRLDLSWLPIDSNRGYNGYTHTADTWYENLTCLWGSYAGTTFQYYVTSTAPKVTETFTMGEDATLIANITVGSNTYKAIIANEKCYMCVSATTQNLRFFNPIEATDLDGRLNEDYNDTILRTALDWFNYTARFNSTNPYVRINGLNSSTVKYFIFSNPMTTTESLTWRLNNLTDYGLESETSYPLYWVHNSTSMGDYTGSQMQNGLDLTIANQTIAILRIGEEGGDSEAPTYSNVGKNTTHAGKPCKFYTEWNDNVGLSGFIFSWNGTGSWQNDTFASLSGTDDWSNVTKTLPSSVGAAVGWRIYAKDTSNNWNNTGVQSFSTTDTTSPTVSDVGKSTTLAGASCKFYAQWSNLELSGFIFGTDNSGSWVNDTWADPWSGTPTSGWSNVTRTLNSTVGLVIQWRIWCNDTSNNWGDTGIQQFTTTEESETIIVIPSSGEDYETETWYMRSDTWNVCTVLGYQLHTHQSTSEKDVEITSASLQTFQTGVMLYKVSTTGVSTQISSGTPVAVVSQNGLTSGMLKNVTWTPSATINLNFDNAIKVVLYLKLATGEWTAKAIFISRNLVTTEIEASTWTFYYYLAVKNISGTYHYQIYFGSSSYNSRIEDISILTLTAWAKMTYWIHKGDLVNFFVTPWTFHIGDLFWGILLLFGCVTLYNRYKRVEPLIVLFWIFGGTGGFLTMLIPVVGLHISWFLLAFALAATLLRLFR